MRYDRVVSLSAFLLLLEFINLPETCGEASDQRLAATIGHLLEEMESVVASKTFTDRPFVTLSFAQSLDSKIGIYLNDAHDETSSNYALSGSESLILTHGLRSMHDGILVGGRTLAIDNPRLSNRLWKSAGESTKKQPRPIVLDTKLHRVMRLVDKDTIRAKNIIVCCSQEAKDMFEKEIRKRTPGLVLLPCNTDTAGRIDLPDMLHRLKRDYGMDSIMVEGGSAIITSFLQEGFADSLWVTIAPKIIGPIGLPAIHRSAQLGRNNSLLEFQISKCVVLGDDIVMWARTVK